MKLEGEYDFEASVQDVWDALFDPAVLAAALPGCDKLELVDGAYHGELKVKVGPVQGKLTGKVDLLDKVEPERYRMVVDGRGPQGFVKANATIALAASGSGTKMRYSSDAQIGGKLATVGGRLLEASAKAIVKQSLEGLNENIKIRAAAYGDKKAEVVETVAPAAPAAPEVVKAEGAAGDAPSAADASSAADADSASAPDSASAADAASDANSASAADAASAPDSASAADAASPSEAAAPAPELAAAAATFVAAPGLAAAATALAAQSAPAAEAPPAAPPAPQYKRADANKMASAVAKEVGKTMAPTIAIAVAILAVLVYLLWLR